MDSSLPAKAKKEVVTRRRHFNMAKSGFLSARQEKLPERDQLIDESKQADIEQLGDCLRALGEGQSMGDFSLHRRPAWPRPGQAHPRDQRIRQYLLERGWRTARRDLQPAECAVRHRPGELRAQSAQAVPAG